MSTFRRSMRTGDPGEFWSPWSTDPNALDPSWPIMTHLDRMGVADPVETCDVHWISLNYIAVQDVRVTYRSDMNHVWHRSGCSESSARSFRFGSTGSTDPGYLLIRLSRLGVWYLMIPSFPIISCRPTATARIQTSVLPPKRRFCPFCLSKICSNARTGAEPCRACRAVDRSISDCWDRCGLIVCWSAGPFE